MNDPDTVMSNFERHKQARAKLSEGNKGAVFDALASANITEVHVEFDGEGDSGQIQTVTAFRGEERIDLPATTVRVLNVAWGNVETVTTESALAMRLKPSVTTTSKTRMAVGKTTTEVTANSASTFRTVSSRSKSTRDTSIPTPANTHFDGGNHGTSLSPFAFQREEMGRHRRRLPAHP
jgi:hypothetical protein